MRDLEAKTLVAALASFFPWPTPPKATVAAYEQQFLGLSDVEAATEAVRAASRSSKRWPPWAELYETYRAIVGRKRGEAAELEESPGVFASPEEARKVLARLDVIPEAGPFAAVVRDFMRGVAGLPSEGNGEAPADEEPELNPGKCSDCRREVPARRRYGEAPQEGGGIGLALCRRCYRSRERVSREVEQAKATAGPAPRPDPEAGPAEGGEAEA